MPIYDHFFWGGFDTIYNWSKKFELKKIFLFFKI
jgi:hypothetical protein